LGRDADVPKDDDMSWNAVKAIRWTMVAVGLGAGIALLAAGATLFGAVLLVMAALRVAMLLAMRRRGTSRPGPMLRRLTRNELDVAAGAIGIAPDDLRRAVDDGHTISAVAADAGIPTQRVVDAVVRDASAKVDRAVAAGNVAPDRARVVHNRLPHWAERFVLSTPAMLAASHS
jgi:hypothetical protein